MSAIGDYVHSRFSRYQKYGVTKKNEQPVTLGTWEEIKKYYAKMARAKAFFKKDLQILEDEFNEKRRLIFMGSPEAGGTMIYDKILSRLTEKYSKSNTIIDLANNSVIGNPDSASTLASLERSKKALSKMKSEDATHYSYKETLERNWKRAQNAIITLGKNTSNTDLRNRIENFTQQITDFFNKGKSFVIKNQLADVAGKTKTTGREKLTRPVAVTMLQEMQELYAITRIGGDFSGVMGDMGEYVSAAASLMMQGLSGEEVSKALDSFFEKATGTTKVSKMSGPDFKQISQKAYDMLRENAKDSFVRNGNSYTISTNFGSQKADILLKAKVGSKEQNLKLSVKNYSDPGRMISLVSGTPLTNLLSSTKVTHANHFLNIFAKHRDQSKYASQINNMKKIAEDALSYFILYRAAIGYGGTGGTANILVVNTNTLLKGTHVPRVKFLDIESVISTVIKSESFGDFVKIYPNPSTLELANPWIKGKMDKAHLEARIAVLLADAHSRKISAHLSPKAWSVAKNSRN